MGKKSRRRRESKGTSRPPNPSAVDERSSPPTSTDGARANMNRSTPPNVDERSNMNRSTPPNPSGVDERSTPPTSTDGAHAIMNRAAVEECNDRFEQLLIDRTVAALMADACSEDEKSFLHSVMNRMLNHRPVDESDSTFTETCASLLDMASRGDTPRFRFDKMQITDHHAWCVDERGNICDYPDEELQLGSRCTMDIVRRPWDARMIAEALPALDAMCDDVFFKLFPDVPRETWLEKIEKNEFPVQYCYPRAKILRDSNPEKYALVIGSLGYKQSDGSIFWEFG